MSNEPDFLSLADQHGLIIKGTPIADGRVHRVPTVGKPGARNGAYLLNADSGGWLQDHATMNRPVAIRLARTDLNPMTARRLAEARQQTTERGYREAAGRAQHTWRKCQTLSEHPYLATKGVQAHGTRLLADRLVVPFGRDGVISTLQWIGPEGSKRFLRGGKKRGAYFAIGAAPTADSVLVIAEGFATAASIHEATCFSTVAAADTGNLLPVAQHLRCRFPSARIVLAADNDETRIGEIKARDAARAVNGNVAMPPDVGTDFNDIHQRDGLDAVRALINETFGVRP